MTKKHFEAFANYIRLSDHNEATKRAMAQMVIDNAGNGAFDRNRFLRACGLA